MAGIAETMIAAYGQGQMSRARELAFQKEKEERQRMRDLQAAQSDFGAGRPETLQQRFPEVYRKTLAEQAQLATAQLQQKRTEMQTAEDRQQIREKLLTGGFKATLADPANWQGFRRYAVESKMFEPYELSEQAPSADMIQKALNLYSRTQRTQGDQAKTQFENTMKLKSMWEGSKIAKQIVDTERALISMQGSPNTIPGQMGLVFGLMKMLDPDSIVRESEQAQAINATGLPGRLENYMLRVKGGQMLGEAQVREMLDAAANLAQAYRKVYSKHAEPMRKMAVDWGLDPDQVVAPIGIPGYGAAKGPGLSPDQEATLENLVQSGLSVPAALEQMGVK